MRRLPRSFAVSMVLLGTAGITSAADVPITGLKLIVVDKTSAGKAKAVFVAKDLAVTKGSGTDASQIAAILDVSYDTVSGSFDMPQGAGWLVNSASVAKYVNKAAPTGGATKVGVIKPGSLVKVVGKSLGDVPLDISAAPAGAVYVADTIVNGPDTTRLCTQFNGCVHKVIAGGSGYKLVCKGNSAGDPTCAAAPPTSTTSTSLVDSSTTSTSLADPCATGNGGCDPLTTCTNDGGDPLCGDCPGGYDGTGNTACTDVNECQTGNGGCTPPADLCFNSPGSFVCDVNECATNNGGCTSGFLCANSPGSFGCNDINECATTNGGCSVLATCANTPGSRTCTCMGSCTGNGFTCTDANECLTNNGGCGVGTCTDTPSCSFTCTP